MYTSGDLAVHDKVVFEANTAGQYGGAVSPPFNAKSPPYDVLFFVQVVRGLVLFTVVVDPAPSKSLTVNLV